MKNVLCDVCNEIIEREKIMEHARSHRDMITHGLVMVARAHPEDQAAGKLLSDLANLARFLRKNKSV